jgi:hypothetical protein
MVDAVHAGKLRYSQLHVFVTLALSETEGTVLRPGLALTPAKIPTVLIGSGETGIAQLV